MSFEMISDEQRSAFIRSLTSGQYNLLLGSGISTDSWNAKGNLPSGEELRQELCDLKNVKSHTSLQRIFPLLTAQEVQENVTNRFVNCSPGPSLLKFPSFIWRRAFTFNIDDAMEAAYEHENSLQTLKPRHFEDPYEDIGPLTELLLVHLHGFSKMPDSGYVFSRNEYIQNISTSNPWMVVLAQFIKSEPFLVIGASLDEIDLDYYLAFRTMTSGREDHGPSVLVTPNPDEVTRHDCKRHGLMLFTGNCLDFFKYCEMSVPQRPTPYELIPVKTQSLLPDSVPQRDALSFWSDFELVPGSTGLNTDVSKFMYGHPPSWSDLSSNLDISRNISPKIISDVEKRLKHISEDCRLVIVFENSGTGKTTILSRCAFELAQRGIKILRCTALSRLEPDLTASMLDLIDGPIVIVADNFADQVTPFGNIIETMEKKRRGYLGGREVISQKICCSSFIGRFIQRIFPYKPSRERRG